MLCWIVCCLSLAQCTPTTSSESLLFQRLSPHLPADFHHTILVGTYKVFENPTKGEGRTIPLHVEVIPALQRENIQPPLFLIDGGPGIGVSNWTYFYSEQDSLYHLNRDLVFVDARGTGQSQALHCLEMQTTTRVEELFSSIYTQENIADCLTTYQDTIDFSQYNTANIVHDLEAVRSWLGYEKINLLGSSYGGKVALHYLQHYPESLERVVLHAPTDPRVNHHYQRGFTAHKALQNLFADCIADSLCNATYPNLGEEFRTLQERFATGPLVVPFGNIGGDSTQIGWEAIATKIHELLYADYDYIRIPKLIHEAYLGNYFPLLQEFHFEPGKPNVFFAKGTYLSIICAEEIELPVTTLDTQTAFLDGQYYPRRKSACKMWPVRSIDVSKEAIQKTTIPVLLFSGRMDPVCPPEMGSKICADLGNCQQITIPFMGHTLGDLSDLACYDQYLIAFLEGREQSLDQTCFQRMYPLPFETNRD